MSESYTVGPYQAPAEPGPDAVTWAMDICSEVGHPFYGNPIAAHQIVRKEDGGEAQVTACGQRLTRWNHLRGWWTTKAGELPLPEHAIHCRADPK